MRKGPRQLAVALTGVVMLAAGGCGGGGGSSSNPAATVKAYLSGVANGDGAAACGTLAPTLRTAVLAAAKAQQIKASSCADLFGQVKAHMTAAQRKQFLGAKVTTAALSGNTARVSVSGASSQPTLQKVGGKWLITGGIGL